MGSFLRQWLRKLFLSAFTPALVTFLGLIAGILGAVYPEKIARAFPFHWTHLNGGISWHAIGFWSCALLSAVLFFFREKVVDAERKKEQQQLVAQTEKLRKEQERLVEQAEKLEHLIRTHPPANFLAIFSRLYEQAAEVEETALSSDVTSSDKSLFAQSVRSVLFLVATLAQKFDGDPPDVEYCVNIMIFKAVHDLSGPERAVIRKRLQFCEEELSVENLRGVLDLEVPLSTTASDEKANSDPGLASFALPIPQKIKTGERSRVLPGAPLAFVNGELDMYIDTRNIREWCDKHGDFSVGVKDELQAYFNGNPNIRSFVSLPIFPDRDHGDPIAVLNIHSNEPALLKGDGEPVAHFADLMSPFQVILTRLVSRYLKIALRTSATVPKAGAEASQAPVPVGRERPEELNI